MHEVEVAIEKITYENKKFPQEALEVIIQNKEKAIPYLRKVIAKAIEEKDEKQENKRCREYLSLAFPLFIEKVRKENIKNFKEYDSRYSIHYFCDEWISKLLELLIESGDTNIYRDVKRCRKEML